MRAGFVLASLLSAPALSVAKSSKSAAPASSYPPPPSPRAHTDEIVFVGCFADDAQRDLGVAEWVAAAARGRSNTTHCATMCAHTAWFAMQRGLCQCAPHFGTGPQYVKLPSAAECGPVCTGEEGLPGPTRYCGGATEGGGPRNAVYTRTRCPFGASVQIDYSERGDLGRSVDGQRQWRGAVRLERWVEGGFLTLDWGSQPVEVYSIWNAKFLVKDVHEEGPLVRTQLRGGKQTEVGFKARGAFPMVPRVECEYKRSVPPPPPLPPREPTSPSPPKFPPPPAACFGASYALSPTGARTARLFTADVTVKSWSAGAQLTVDFGVKTEVTRVWQATLAAVTPTTATFALSAQYGRAFKFTVRPCG